MTYLILLVFTIGLGNVAYLVYRWATVAVVLDDDGTESATIDAVPPADDADFNQ